MSQRAVMRSVNRRDSVYLEASCCHSVSGSVSLFQQQDGKIVRTVVDAEQLSASRSDARQDTEKQCE